MSEQKFTHNNPKNRLQEYLQSISKPKPVYTTTKVDRNMWVSTVSTSEGIFTSVPFTRKVDAEKAAATLMLDEIADQMFFNDTRSSRHPDIGVIGPVVEYHPLTTPIFSSVFSSELINYLKNTGNKRFVIYFVQPCDHRVTVYQNEIKVYVSSQYFEQTRDCVMAYLNQCLPFTTFSQI